MKNNVIVLETLAKILDKDPIISVSQDDSSIVSFKSLGGKVIDIGLNSFKESDEFNQLIESDQSYEMAFKILSNRINTLTKSIDSLEGIDTTSVVHSVLEGYGFDDRVRTEVESQVSRMGEGVSDTISSTVIDAITNSVNSSFNDLSERLNITNTSISELVDTKTLKSTISKEITKVKKLISQLEIPSEERIKELIEQSTPVQPVQQNAVTSFEVRDGHMFAQFGDGSERDLGVYLNDFVMGVAGEAGKRGKSAFEIAVRNGFIGTEVEWLDSLKGEDGASSGESGTLDIFYYDLTGLSETIGEIDHEFEEFYSYRVIKVSTGEEVGISIVENGLEFVIEAFMDMTGLQFILSGKKASLV